MRKPAPLKPIPAPDSARHHIQLCWRPAMAGESRLGLEDNTIYLLYYRCF